MPFVFVLLAGSLSLAQTSDLASSARLASSANIPSAALRPARPQAAPVQAASSRPSFTKDIAPILWTHCAPCHRAGQIAPFSLLTYEAALPRARQIAAVTRNHTMPPWLPEPGHGEFVGERRLSDGDIQRIQDWVSAGAPRGKASDLPPMPAWPSSDRWQLGKPDLVVQAAEPYILRPGATDVFRNIVIPVPLASTRYVRGIEVDPGNRRVVHHIALAVDPTPASRRLDEADPQPGFAGVMFSESARSPESRALGWTPGMTPAFEPEGMAWRLQKGSDLVLLLHLMTSPNATGARNVGAASGPADGGRAGGPGRPASPGMRDRNGGSAASGPADDDKADSDKADSNTAAIDGASKTLWSGEKVQPRVALYFTDTPPTRTPIDFKLGVKDIEIPAGTSDYRVTDTFTLPVDVDVLSIYPHAHYLAREMRVEAKLPDGPLQDLLWISRWDFQWQDQYRYRTPIALPRGTVVTMEYVYDNSAGNKRNPRAQPVSVSYGPQSTDEMGDLWLRLLPRSREDAAVLARAYRDHDLQSDIAVAQKKAAASPGDGKWRKRLGASYLQAGRVAEATVQLEEALRLASGDAEAHNNLGLALQMQGRTAEALPHFREAMRLSPDADLVHLNLANALDELGQTAEALPHFEEAIRLNPSAAEAYNNYGVALGSLGRIDDAIRQFEIALTIRPDYEDAQKNLALARQLPR